MTATLRWAAFCVHDTMPHPTSSARDSRTHTSTRTQNSHTHAHARPRIACYQCTNLFETLCKSLVQNVCPRGWDLGLPAAGTPLVSQHHHVRVSVSASTSASASLPARTHAHTHTHTHTRTHAHARTPHYSSPVHRNACSVEKIWCIETRFIFTEILRTISHIWFLFF